MRRKTVLLGSMALVAVIFMAITAMPASAFPAKTSACSACHVGDSAVSVSVNVASSGATFTTYSYSITGPYSGASGYGVFDASGAKVAGDYGASGTFSVANGGSYTFYGLNKDPANMNGYASTTLNPAASATPTPTIVPPAPTTTVPPTPTTVPPTTTPVPSPVPSSDETQIEGILQSVDGNIWVIDGITVTVDVSTTVDGGTPTVGSKVEISGITAADGTVIAQKVEAKQAEDENHTATPVPSSTVVPSPTAEAEESPRDEQKEGDSADEDARPQATPVPTVVSTPPPAPTVAAPSPTRPPEVEQERSAKRDQVRGGDQKEDGRDRNRGDKKKENDKDDD